VGAHQAINIYKRFYFEQITIWNSADAARETGKKSYRIQKKGYSRIAYLLLSLNSYSEVISPINRVMIMYQGC